VSAPVSIISVMEDEALFLPWFRDQRSWSGWKTFLRVLFGLRLSAADRRFFRKCTGLSSPPRGRVEECWAVCGRRGGKSLVLALVGVYLAIFVDHSRYLVPGELALIRILAADKKQARAIFGYAKAMVERVPLMGELIETVSETDIVLKNGIALEIAAASWRTVRGATLIACLCDEVAIWRNDLDGSNPDKEILDATRPAMATVEGSMLLLAGSPYARRGEMWETFKRWHGRPGGPVVWRADSRTMNPSLPKRVIDEAFERDEVSAMSEFGRDGEIAFRSDLESYVSREVVEACVVPGRFELRRQKGVIHHGFGDVAGGSGGDSFVSGVGYYDRERKVIVIAALRERKPPFSPEATVAESAAFYKSYGVRRIKMDRYGGDFPPEQYRKNGVTCEPADKAKSDLYVDALPWLNSRAVELPDNARLVAQLSALERRTARGTGRDIVDHSPGGHDDLANVCCGLIALIAASVSGEWIRNIGEGARAWARGVTPPRRRPPPADPLAEIPERRLTRAECDRANSIGGTGEWGPTPGSRRGVSGVFF
jgi:hypothetical protein